MASCGLRRRGAGSRCHQTPKQAGRVEIPQEIDEATRQSGKRHHGSLRLIQSRAQRAGRARKTTEGKVAQQPRRELAPAVSTTQTRDAAFQAHAKSTEIGRRPFLRLKPLQPGKIVHQQRQPQVDSRRRSRRVASILFRIGSRFPRQTKTGSNSSDSTFAYIADTKALPVASLNRAAGVFMYSLEGLMNT